MAKSAGSPETPGQPRKTPTTQENPSEAPKDAIENLYAPFKDAAEQYGTALVQLSASLQEAQQEALQDYLDALASSLKPAQLDPVSAAYQDLLKAASSQDSAKIAAAHVAYTDKLKELHAGVETAATSAARSCSESLQSSWQSAQEEARAAYQSYIKSIKTGFNSLPDQATNPASLIWIGQSLCAAGSFAVRSGGATAS